MAEEPVSVFPAPTLPSVFADGVRNLSTTTTTARFYLVRNDPSMEGDTRNQVQVFSQIVMPLSGFCQAFAFFERTLENMAKTNPNITLEINEARRLLAEAANK